MPAPNRAPQIVIAGASSLLGAELKSLLEESRLAGADLRLLDEEFAGGTLTEAGGEAAVIQPVEEDSFKHAGTVFFAGSPGFTRANRAAAQSAGAKLIDLSGATAGERGVEMWFSKLDALRSSAFPKDAHVFAIPSAAAAVAASLVLGLTAIGLRRLVLICFQPVSEAGRAGVEELESQTGQLLSFQGMGQPVFDAQVAFNMLDRFGPASHHKLGAARERLFAETKACLGAHAQVPSLQLLHAPVFYATTFAACAEFAPETKAEWIAQACEKAGFAMPAEAGAAPSNVSVAGEKAPHLARPEADPARPGTWWFWGAADNMRLPAANAVKLAEMLA